MRTLYYYAALSSLDLTPGDASQEKSYIRIDTSKPERVAGLSTSLPFSSV